MRVFKMIVLAVLAVLLVMVAMANAQFVTLRFVPEAMAGFLGLTWTVTLPLFVVVLLAVGVGLLIGYLFEWLREHKHRAAARAERRERESLEREVREIKPHQRKDKGGDILALLEDGSVPRSRAS